MVNYFRYQESLAQAKNDRPRIRLLELHPASRSKQPLDCRLVVVEFEESLEYTALSYTWGNPDDGNMVEMQICTQPFKITSNLDAALRRLRQKKNHVRLWIDAICINQQDSIEKGTQIRLMGDIYSRASQVAIWLGEAGEGSHKAFKMLKRWGELRDVEQFEAITGFNGPVHPVADGSFVTAMRYTSEKDWQAIKALLNRAWWSRVWVVQEVAMAQDAVLLCGEDELSWYYLSRTVEIVSQLLAKNILDTRYSQFLFLDHKSDVVSMCRLHERGALDMMEILDLTANRYHATHHRDLIYGLLGLALPESLQVQVTYEMEMGNEGKKEYKVKDWRVFAELFRCAVEQRNSLRLLCRAGVGVGNVERREKLDLPSWVPDFGPLRPKNRHWGPTQMDHSRADGEREPQVRFSSDLRTMEVTGVIFDTVVRVFGPSEGLTVGEKLLRWCRAACDGPGAYPTGIPRLQAFFRTLICYLAPSTRLDLAKGHFWETALGFMCCLGTVSSQLLESECPKEFSRLKKILKKNDTSKAVDGMATYLFLDSWADSKHDEFIQELEQTDDILEFVFRPFLGSEDSDLRLKLLPNEEEDIEADPMLFSPPTIFNIAVPGNRQRQLPPSFPTSPSSMPRRGAHLGQTSSYQRIEGKFSLHCADVCKRFAFYVTEAGYMGVGPSGLCEGDELCILPGCRMPLAIGNIGDQYQLVGSCYIQGGMQGEFVKDGGGKTTKIKIC